MLNSYYFMRLFLIVTVMSSSAALHGQETGKDLAQDISTSRDKLKTLEDQENLALLRYRPAYVIFGNPDTKAQISFKFLLIRTIPVYVGYSQLIFWRLTEPSKPMQEVIYNPEVFYRWSFKNQHFTSVDIGPWSHISNGRKGEVSRSIDHTFARLNTRWDFSDTIILATLTASMVYNSEVTNLDLIEYSGPLEIQVSWVNFFDIERIIDKGDLSLRCIPGGRFGERWTTGGYELGYNFRFGSFDVFPTFYLQYYQGFAESMIEYDKHVRQIRAGISF